MRKYLSSILFLFVLIKANNLTAQKTPIPIIFDTDIAPDYDDVGAMALLHNFADTKEIKMLATISCNAAATTVPTISVINTYFKRPDIPIGIGTGLQTLKCDQKWADSIIKKYPHPIKSNNEAMDAVALYRKILSKQKDHSVTILTVGFLTNLANLLDSKPDNYSPLNGLELVSKKVKHLVSMAGALNKQGLGREYNLYSDIKSSKKVIENWPTDITLTGDEIGNRIPTGIRLINNSSIQDSPIKDAYRIALTFDKNTIGRSSWDQTAVLIAARGISPYFNSEKLNFEILEDGTNKIVPGERINYVSFKMTPEEIAKIIEDLMMHQPQLK